jgi:hypothetical protein
MAAPPVDLSTRLAKLDSRGDVKRFGAEVDRDPALRAALVALAAARGLAVGEDETGKQLVRAVLARADGAQVRKNPIHRDEAFACVHCGAEIPPGGALVRDHCPRCLRGRHVDVVPGDRAATCGGTLDPVGLELRAQVGVVIHHLCRGCGHRFTVRAHPDDRVPASLAIADIA